jgi:signal recognition particle subunit SRP54
MGDVIGLIEKAESTIDPRSALTRTDRMLGGAFDLADWLEQMKQVRRMGPLAQITDMLPGRLRQAAQKSDPQDLERGFRASEAIINSMTLVERRSPEILNASRRRRIAAGSGTGVQDVNRLIKQFREAQKLFKAIKASGPRGLPKLFG